ILVDTSTTLDDKLDALHDLSSGDVVTAVGTALATYDPPTRAEATSDKAEILTAVGDVPTTAELATALAGADDAVLAAIASLDTVADSILALLDDPRGEPGQGAPPVSADLVTKVDYLYKLARNKRTQTATELTIFADNGTTADHKATVSDD